MDVDQLSGVASNLEVSYAQTRELDLMIDAEKPFIELMVRLPDTPGIQEQKPSVFLFRELPPELRIQIYEDIIYTDGSRLRTAKAFRDYRGIIMSCRTMKHEFEYEWARNLNDSIANILNTWPHQPQTSLSALPITKLEDSKRIEILFSGDLQLALQGAELDSHPAVRNLLDQLLHTFPSILFRPNTSFIPQHGTVAGFVRSHEFFWHVRLRQTLRQQGPDFHWQTPIEWLSELFLDGPPCSLQLHYPRERAAHTSSFPEPDLLLYQLLRPYPHELCKVIYEQLVASCTTMDDLRQNAGWMLYSEDFICALLRYHSLGNLF